MATTTASTAPTSPKNLAQNAEAPKDGLSPDSYPEDRYIAEPKMDGWRLLAHVDGDGKVHLYTRTGNAKDGSLPNIEAELGEQLPPGTWLDGEAVAMQLDGDKVLHDWGTVQSVLGSGTTKAAAQSEQITFVVFDLISHGGIDARPLPYMKRRAVLESLFDKVSFTSRIQLSAQVAPSTASADALLAQGFEGMMIKDKLARYASGKRGAGWIKIKPSDNLDCVILDCPKNGQNGFTGMVGSIELGLRNSQGELVSIGTCSGMDMTTRTDMTKHPENWIGRVVEIKYHAIMPSGGLRHPAFVRVRLDKTPEMCDCAEHYGLE